MRDAHRQAVYAAEHRLEQMFDSSYDFPKVEIYGSTLTLPIERKFADLSSVQRYVNSVLGLNWVRERYVRANKPVRVRERKGHTKAHYESWDHIIALPLHEQNKAWALREVVVLHELAHHLCGASGHGPQFCGILVTLMREIIGPEAGFILQCLYHDEGVEVDFGREIG